MSRIIQALVAIAVFLVIGIALFVPSLVLTIDPFTNWAQFEPVVCGETIEDDRINCYPELDRPTAKQCEMRGCCFQRITWDISNRIPECYFPLGIGYRVIGEQQDISEGFQLELFRLHTPRFFYEEIENVRFRAEFYKENILHMKMYEYRYVDRSEIRFAEREDRRWKPRYEVPLDYPKTTLKNSWPEYEIVYERNPFTFQVMRTRTNTPLLDTRIGGMVFEDQFLQLSARLPNSMMFGLGEHNKLRYRHEVNWHTWGIFAADNEPGENQYVNLNGHHPFFMALDDQGNTFGVLFANSNAMDIVLTPATAVTWRATGGIFDFWVFTGPTPEMVIAQYTEVVGRPQMPPFWALGYQVGREDWANVEEMQQVVDNNVALGIPFDTIYSDVTYMKDFMTFTYDDVTFAGLPDFVRNLNNNGMKFIISLAPGVSSQVPEPKTYYHFYYYGNKWGYFINETDKKTQARGFQWPGEVAFSDFTNPDAKDWWATFANDFADILPFDGVDMTMNEPGNMVNGSKIGCGNRKWNFPPFVPTLGSRMLYYKTICMDYEQHLGLHYNIHSLNGLFAAWAGENIMEQVKPEKRSVVLSRSTFPGSGRYGGHALGKNQAGWDEMYKSLVAVMDFNLFGIPYVGPNACGYYENTDMELCIRWTQMAAFFPIFRTYKGRGMSAADPASLGSEYIESTREAFKYRYWLLPYIYTQFYHARLDGWSVIRPVLNEFPGYENAWDVDWEFMLGRALLVAPVLHQGATAVNMYVPDDRFYDLYDGAMVVASMKDSNTTVQNVDLDRIVLRQRGGTIIPLQKGPNHGVANSTQFSRLDPITLIIGIHEELREQAYGDLFWDDGETWNSYERNLDLYLEFFANRDRLDILSQRTGMIEANPKLIDDLPVIEAVTFYGMTNNPGLTVAVDNQQIETSQFVYDPDNFVFNITGLALDIISDHTIELGATSDPI